MTGVVPGRMGRVLEAMAHEWARAVLSLQLLLGRRAILYLVADGLVLLYVAVMAFSGLEESTDAIYVSILVPFLALAVPILGELVALERRARSLDLVLAGPDGARYFVRRATALGAVMALQGWFIVLMARITMHPFPLLPPLLQVIVVATFLCAAGLYWSTRFRSPGAVSVATLVTALGFARWMLHVPIYGRAREVVTDLEFFTTPAALVAWLRPNLVMAGAAVLFYLYVRRRLERPALLLHA